MCCNLSLTLPARSSRPSQRARRTTHHAPLYPPSGGVARNERGGQQVGRLFAVLLQRNQTLASPEARSSRREAEARHHRQAFTLVEIMVVIVIIGLLAGAVTMSVRSYLVAGKQNVAKMEITNITQALQTFYSTYDRYPSNEEGLEALAAPSDQYVDGLLSKVPVDPWKNSYQYNQPGRKGPFEVVSFGADGREGGEGADRDISSDELSEAKK